MSTVAPTVAMVCLGCGLDLSRRPARPDGRYGLPLVPCPRCGRCTHRRTNAGLHRRRRRRALARVAAVLLLQVVVLAGLTAALGGQILFLQETFDVLLRAPLFTVQRRWADLVTVVATCIAGGVWLSTGLGHLGWRRAWTIFAAWLGLWLIAVPAAAIAARWGLRAAGLGQAVGRWAVLEPQWQAWSIRAGLIGLALTVALAGMPLGAGIRRLLARRGAAARRRMRRRRRAARRR